ncbi:MAG: malate dehydrogenase (quinone) [Rhodothermia bacterium]|nr:malate dehydrogenase (quinone) [Rhodothermia bacterium]
MMEKDTDFLLIGGGIMSATLGVLIQEFWPQAHILMVEKLSDVACESSEAWNNAGTGHAAFCELNYTPMQPDGSIDTKKAIQIGTSFELSKTFWAYLVKKDKIPDPKCVIRRVPHHSFVWGAENAAFLRRRHEALKTIPLFHGMQFSEDRRQIATWLPLVMNGRSKLQPIAATRMEYGTDVDFGSLTRTMIQSLKTSPTFRLITEHEVRGLRQMANNRWQVNVKNLIHDEVHEVSAKFVFIGAGGGTLPLLDKSGIPEATGYAGFPVGGQWLRCTNQDVIDRHFAKVYGQAEVGAPPMSVPHLDTRFIKGKKALLFGPFAGFSTKFLKYGSYFDLPLSVELDNFIPLLAVGWHEFDLTKYLVKQVTQSLEERLEALRAFFPEVVEKDWEIEIAGQRVQIIKPNPEKGGTLAFGTEVVTASDGSLAALLGASPGASTSVGIMLDVLQKCFKKEWMSQEVQQKLHTMLPWYGTALHQNPRLCKQVRDTSASVLQL